MRRNVKKDCLLSKMLTLKRSEKRIGGMPFLTLFVL